MIPRARRRRETKRIIVLLLILNLVTCLAACGGSGAKTADPSGGAAVTSAPGTDNFDKTSYAGTWTGKKNVEYFEDEYDEYTYTLTLSQSGEGELVQEWTREDVFCRYAYSASLNGTVLSLKGREYRRDGETVDIAEDDFVTFKVSAVITGGKLELGEATDYDTDNYDLSGDFPVTLTKVK